VPREIRAPTGGRLPYGPGVDAAVTEVEVDRLTWRPVTAADAPALARLHAAAEEIDRTGEHYGEDDLAEELAEPTLDLLRDTRAAVAPGGELLAWGSVRVPAEVRDVDRVWLSGVVHPGVRRRGIGRRLLDWQERRGGELHRTRHLGTPGELLVGVYDTAASQQALVESAGFTAARWFSDMERDLRTDLPPVPAVPSGLRLVPYHPAYDEGVRLAHREAFADHWGSTPPDPERWRHWYTGSQSFRPDVSLLVLDGDEVAAYLLTYFFAADARATGVREAWVGQLGTRGAWRRRGLASLLLVAALHRYRDAGYQRAGLDVDSENASGALGLYQRLGFVVDHRSVTWRKPVA
jgi:mycothiol synthase